MSDYAQKILQVYKELGVKIGEMLLIQVFYARIGPQYANEINDALEELVVGGYLEQKETSGYFLIKIE